MAEPFRDGRLGVVAIGRNEGERLPTCLASIGIGEHPSIYVDSGSTDRSVEAAKQLGARTLPLDPARPFTAARGREEGWRALLADHAGLDYVQFIDGDCELERGWLATAVEFLDAHPSVAVVCGRCRERFPDRSLYNALCDEEWSTPVGPAASSGGIAMMRVAALRAVGGFDPAMRAGEEPELCSRMREAGWQVWRIDAPMTIHDAAMTRFSQWWARARRSGAGYAQAWGKSAGRPERLYRRELARAVAWGGILPLASLGLAVAVDPLALAIAPVVLGGQIVRLSRRMGWRKASLATVTKFAELSGALDWWWQAATARQRSATSYK